MKKLGKIVSTENGKLVLKTDKDMRKGRQVYDESNRFIGNIIKFKEKGEEKYAVISTKKDPEPLIGEKIYG